MAVVPMPPQIRLVCDECETEPGEEEYGGFFTFDADDVDKALRDADYHRIGQRIVCDNCAYELDRADDAVPSALPLHTHAGAGERTTSAPDGDPFRDAQRRPS